MNQEIIKSSLTKLGYELKDFGNHWRTNAMYRGGTNPTAVLIYKDTGVWTDFVKNTPCLPFKDLVSATIKTNDKNVVDKFMLGLDSSTPLIQKTRMSMEKTYDPSVLDKLLPHYLFYNKKGIEDDRLINLKSGLATQGAMYQRYVFPIFNQDGLIHGFSGRDMTNKPNRPKWKHVGKKANWLFPIFTKVEGEYKFLNSIQDKKSIILVESIGDVLALHQSNIYNCISVFGTSISSKVLCFLVGLELDQITISLNNDVDKEMNRGRIGSIKCFSKLLNYFDKEKMRICPPTQNDFGEMSADEISFWSENRLDSCLSLDQVKKDASLYYKHKELTKSCYNHINKI
jgi:hypothetical protein